MKTWVRRSALVAGGALVIVGTSGIAAGAQIADPVYDGSFVPANTDAAVNTNLLWVVIGAILVVFMQAGFALVETGFCRKKHAAHVMSTNFAIFGLGFVGFFFVGFPLAFGGFSYPGYFGMDAPVGESLIKIGDWVFLWQGGWALTDLGTAAAAAPIAAFFFYMVAFMDTVATIPTGAMAERWKWNAFVGWGLFCGAIYYPLFAAWTWGGGWLNQLGNNARARLRLRRLRRLRRRARGRRCCRPRGCARARAPHRQVRQGRQAARHAGTQHPDGDARRVHPAVRLVRVQRRVDVRSDRRAVRGCGARTPPSRQRSVPPWRCSTHSGGSGSPTPA